jgi:RNA polymerase sigma factor (sigma-70 family)
MYAQIFNNELVPHSDALFTFAMRYTSDAFKADDLLQETFLRAWLSIDKYQTGTNPKAWLFKICFNLFVNDYRSNKNKPRKVELEEKVLGDKKIDTQMPTELALDEIYSDEVVFALAKINNENRILFLLFLEGFSYAEMATITETELNTVRTKLKRTKDKLAIDLEEYAKTKGIYRDE